MDPTATHRSKVSTSNELNSFIRGYHAIGAQTIRTRVGELDVNSFTRLGIVTGIVTKGLEVYGAKRMEDPRETAVQVAGAIASISRSTIGAGIGALVLSEFGPVGAIVGGVAGSTFGSSALETSAEDATRSLFDMAPTVAHHGEGASAFLREPTTRGNELNGLDLIAEEIFGSRLPSEALGTVWGTQDAAAMAVPDHYSSTTTKQSQAAASPSFSGSTASPSSPLDDPGFSIDASLDLAGLDDVFDAGSQDLDISDVDVDTGTYGVGAVDTGTFDLGIGGYRRRWLWRWL